MKSILMTVLFLGVSILAFSQDKRMIEIYGNFLIPTGTLSEKQDPGLEVGVMGFIPIASSTVELAIGADVFMFLPGKEEILTHRETRLTINWADYYPYKIMIGSYFPLGGGIYILPLINGNFEPHYNWNHVGFDFIAGYRFGIAGQTLDIRAQFSSLDPFEKGDKNLASVGMGILF
jgi:hypothetical protein